MDHMPVIHVIIPVYKAEKYIAQTLDSVLAQPYPNIEIVCVDDGSPDGSIFILWEYEKMHENIHEIQQENGGDSKARNTGIEYVLSRCADTDYIAFLDADDLWVKDVSAGFCDDLSGYPDFVGYQYVRCSEDLRSTAPASEFNAQQLPGGSKNVWCHLIQPFTAALYSCQLLRTYSVRFIENLCYAEDHIFRNTCLFLAQQIRLVDRVMYCYRINPASAMHHRKSGMDDKPDIIRGYLKTAVFLQPYENEQRGSSKFCNIMAGVHAMEMAEEHYRKFRSARSLERFLQENPNITETIRRLDRNDLSENHQQLYDRYHSSPLRFRLRCYLEGLKQVTMDQLKKLPPIANRLYLKRFPIPNEYL